MTELPLFPTLMAFLPPVPLTVTVSAAPSPTPVPGWPERSMSTCFASVPVRLSTVMLSAPPLAVNWICSMLLRSMVMLATSRVKRTCEPLAAMSIFSLTLAPLNSSVSLPS